jgi:catechol 2,3-dioxygenase-like lactoylglutathione lyase family enzyme
MRLTHLAPLLGVRDVKASIAFYTEVLGFTLKGTYGPDPDHPGWCYLDRDGVGLMCNAYEPHDHGDDEEHDHEHPAAPVLTGSLYFYVDDVDALYEALKDKAPLQGEPTNYDWGMREIGLTDPDGYQLVFGQNIE